LTGRPNIHQYLYRSSTGAVRTALDHRMLSRVDHDPTALIDLEAMAWRVCEVLGRPLLTLRLNRPKHHAANDTACPEGRYR
jgi:hypothetical protein